MSNKITKKQHIAKQAEAQNVNPFYKDGTPSVAGVGLRASGKTIYNAISSRAVNQKHIHSKNNSPQLLQVIRQANTVGGRFSLFKNSSTVNVP